jgi:DNA repair protein RadC
MVDDPVADLALHAGHRSRLLSRFRDSGIASLADYEIIELILMYAIPRRDTKPIAKELIKRFKSLSGILHAQESELTKVNGLGERACELLHLFRDVATYCLREKYEKRPLVAHRRDVEEYLRFAFGFRGDEYVAALFLDNGNNVVNTEIIAEGTVNQCAVYPRVVIERALACKASSVIMAHNHPGGAVKPSEADWHITERLFALGKLLDMPLLDHLIINREGAVSLRDFPRWPK